LFHRLDQIIRQVYRQQLVCIGQFLFTAYVNDRLEQAKRRVIGEVHDSPALQACVPASIRQLSSLASQIRDIADAIEDQT